MIEKIFRDNQLGITVSADNWNANAIQVHSHWVYEHRNTLLITQVKEKLLETYRGRPTYKTVYSFYIQLCSLLNEQVNQNYFIVEDKIVPAIEEQKAFKSLVLDELKLLYYNVLRLTSKAERECSSAHFYPADDTDLNDYYRGKTGAFEQVSHDLKDLYHKIKKYNV